MARELHGSIADSAPDGALPIIFESSVDSPGAFIVGDGDVTQRLQVSSPSVSEPDITPSTSMRVPIRESSVCHEAAQSSAAKASCTNGMSMATMMIVAICVMCTLVYIITEIFKLRRALDSMQSANINHEDVTFLAETMPKEVMGRVTDAMKEHARQVNERTDTVLRKHHYARRRPSDTVIIEEVDEERCDAREDDDVHAGSVRHGRPGDSKQHIDIHHHTQQVASSKQSVSPSNEEDDQKGKPGAVDASSHERRDQQGKECPRDADEGDDASSRESCDQKRKEGASDDGNEESDGNDTTPSREDCHQQGREVEADQVARGGGDTHRDKRWHV
jgi:hypothetical protein